MGLADDLSKLNELRTSGALSEEEFMLAKGRLLHPEAAPPAGPTAVAANPFRRSSADRWLGGVCGGIARATATESWLWRLLFAALFICAGAGLLLYLLLWIFVPRE